MDEYENMMDELWHEQDVLNRTTNMKTVDRVIENAEGEIYETEARLSRQEEIQKLRKELSKLLARKGKLRNTKNHRRRNINNQLAEKRKKLTKKIEDIRLRLNEIEVEESNTASQHLNANQESDDELDPAEKFKLDYNKMTSDITSATL